MIKEGALVIYKGKPAIVKELSEGKIIISLHNNEQIKVRDKDVEHLHPGPVNNFKQIESSTSEEAIREVWELLAGEGTNLSLKDLAALINNEYSPASAYNVYNLLKDGLYFTGTITEILPRKKDDVIAEEKKRNERTQETGERTRFLERLKACLKNLSKNMLNHDDTRFIQDIEALAYGKSVKSRTMKELGLSETPEDAHSLLLKTGFWDKTINPHPDRFGLSLNNANIIPAPPRQEQRRDLTSIPAFAIDSPWSSDPDDAISIEKADSGNNILYVHIADIAASITFNSPAEKEARDRGATLYLPEGAVRMLAEETLPMFALGLSEKSLALTFMITLDNGGYIINTEIFPSIIKVKRITYEEADGEINNANTESAKALCALNELSILIHKRRISHGAIDINMPDIHISVKEGNVEIEQIIQYKSASIVRECMIAAGEGAGVWALERGLPFPYISQDVEIKSDKQESQAEMNFSNSSLSNSWQLRRCMRPRIYSTKPGCHQGLGLETYSQVTSPLRRYTDLLAHLQIRAFLRGETLITADDISARLGYSEAATTAVVQAERASNNHWLMVYLSEKKDSLWDAITLENKGNRTQVIIPSLAMETLVSLQKNISPDENVKLTLKSVNISRGEAIFI